MKLGENCGARIIQQEYYKMYSQSSERHIKQINELQSTQ